MEIDEILAELDLEIDNRLHRFNNTQLRNLLSTLAQNMKKQELTDVLCDDKYFSKGSLVRLLDKENKQLLYQILNEPNKEEELRIPIENWLREDGYKVRFEVPYKIGRRRRVIDVLGWKKLGYLSRGMLRNWKDHTIIAIESKIKTSRNALDKAFSQATDYSRCAQYRFVAISPYLFYKFSDVVLDKIERNEKIGVMLVDKSRVIRQLSSPVETGVDKETYTSIKEYLRI